MTDIDKLIELLNSVQCKVNCCIAVDKRCADLDNLDRCQIQAIAEYLIENRVIVPPCKVGDMIYFVVKYDGEYFLDEGEVGSVYKDNGSVWVSARYDSGLHYHHKESDFGKTVFLTKEEAEQALLNRSNGNA